MARKTRALIRAPKTYTRAERFIVANGTPMATETNCLIYNKGNCPAATVSNPHDRGTQAETCSDCFAVS